MSEPRTAAGRRMLANVEPRWRNLPWDPISYDLTREEILEVEAEAGRIDVPPETEAVRRCVTHHACACHERLAEIGRRYIKAYEAEP
jgi:hypothetical protein